MKRIIIGYDEGGSFDEFKKKYFLDFKMDFIEIPDNAAITITTKCGECLLVERSCGNTLSCKHPKAMQLRPYTDTPDHKNERKVTADKRPNWCPL